MENKTNKESPAREGRWFSGYVVAGLIWVFAQSFRKTAVDEFIILIVAIGAGFFYYRIKAKIKIKNDVIRVIITFFIIEIITAILISLATTIANRLI